MVTAGTNSNTTRHSVRRDVLSPARPGALVCNVSGQHRLDPCRGRWAMHWRRFALPVPLCSFLCTDWFMPGVFPISSLQALRPTSSTAPVANSAPLQAHISDSWRNRERLSSECRVSTHSVPVFTTITVYSNISQDIIVLAAIRVGHRSMACVDCWPR